MQQRLGVLVAVALIAVLVGSFIVTLNLRSHTRNAVQPTSVSTVIPTMTTPPNATLHMVFDEEFNGTQLDSYRWNTQWPWGRTENSPSGHTYFAQDNVTVADGHLMLRVDGRSIEGRTYTGGMITSQGKFSQTYGYIEIRAKFPRGEGLQGGLGLIPLAQTNGSTYITALQIVNHTNINPFWRVGTDTIWMMSQAGNDQQGKPNSVSKTYTGTDFSTGYHTVGIDW